MRVAAGQARIVVNRYSVAAVLLIAVSVAMATAVRIGHQARAQDDDVSVAADLRIAAQRSDDGTVRFGLRARDANGEWAQPVTPRLHRFDPANASIGRWLVSSPLTLELDHAGPRRLVRSDRLDASSAGGVELASGLEGWAGDARYSAYHDEAGNLVTFVSVYSAMNGTPDGELRTTITCADGDLSVSLHGLPNGIGDDANQLIRVTWSVDNGTRHSERRPIASARTGSELVLGTQSRLADALLGYGSQIALSIGTTSELTTNIDLGALRALPVYDNLRHCAMEAVQTGRTELRIRAQVRDDERIEFAVQQRIAGGWSDNILPRARTISAFGTATDWLSSTTVSVWVELDTQQDVIPASLVVRQPPDPITPVIRSGSRTFSVAYWVDAQDIQGYHPTKLNSMVAAISEQGLRLEVGCLGDERRVSLSRAPSDTTGGLSLAFDDTQLSASWSVSHSNGSTSLSPADTERTIQRLRQAQSLSVRLDHGDAVPITFDLTELFETPIQANLDHCGHYAPPAWQPVTSEIFAYNEFGEYYAVRYPEWNNLQRTSQVRVTAVEGRPAPGANSLDLVMTCESRRVTFTIWGLPDVPAPDSIRLRIDGGEWFAVPVRTLLASNGTASAAFRIDLSRLRQGRELYFAYGLDQPAPGAFDLTTLFGMPIQANFDNCSREYWPPVRTYVPVVVPETRSSQHLSYVARDNEDGTVYTRVWLTEMDVPAGDGTVSLFAQCFDSSALQLQMVVLGVIEPGTYEMSLTIDDRPPETSTWTVASTTTHSTLFPPSNAHLLAQLRGASVVTLAAPGVLPAPISLRVAGMMDTLVQANLDECGYYRPGEIRSLYLPLNAYAVRTTPDPERGLNVVRFWQRTPDRAETATTLTQEVHRHDDRLLVGLSVSCGAHGIRLSVFGDVVQSLPGNQVEVEWRIDGASAQRELWNVIGSAGKSISPQRARAVMASWREASDLEFRLLGADAAAHHFNLGTMFDIPVIETFDECLDIPVAPQSPVVTGIPLIKSGNLWFAAMFFNGSGWLTSYLSLPDTGTAPAQEDARDTRSLLALSCGMDGLDIAIDNLDRAQSAFIQGDAVDVTWTIDGRSRTESWGAWIDDYDYSISPRDDREFYQALKTARTLRIVVESDPPISKTYELAKHNFWGTTVQPNLDACDDP